MKSRELFSVLLKALGVWEIVGGIEALPNYITSFATYNNERQYFAILLANMLSFSVLKIVAGVFLVFGADWISQTIYPEPGVPVSE